MATMRRSMRRRCRGQNSFGQARDQDGMLQRDQRGQRGARGVGCGSAGVELPQRRPESSQIGVGADHGQSGGRFAR